MDSKRIVLQAAEIDGDIGGDVGIYNLTRDSVVPINRPASTSVPLVQIGDVVEAGDMYRGWSGNSVWWAGVGTESSCPACYASATEVQHLEIRFDF